MTLDDLLHPKTGIGRGLYPTDSNAKVIGITVGELRAVERVLKTLPVRRAWINQPSTLQPHHDLHGVRVLAQAETDKISRVWFTSGPIISQQVQTVALSDGWPE